jgi:hypothetical protein
MSEEKDMQDFPLGKTNFILIAAGAAVVIIGFFLLSGGGAEDVETFNPEVFSPRRMNIAPITILLGYGIVMWGIIKK